MPIGFPIRLLVKPLRVEVFCSCGNPLRFLSVGPVSSINLNNSFSQSRPRRFHSFDVFVKLQENLYSIYINNFYNTLRRLTHITYRKKQMVSFNFCNCDRTETISVSNQSANLANYSVNRFCEFLFKSNAAVFRY